MERNEFEQYVVDAIERLPRNIRGKIKNVALCVEDWPSHDQFQKAGTRRGDTLLGLYEGVPLTERGSGYGMVLPDKITIFQGPIEEMCRTEDDVRAQVRRTVVHEIAHFFGISDEQLRRMGAY